MALQRLSLTAGRLKQGYPLRLLIVLRRRAKHIPLRKDVFMSGYASSFFSASYLASCLKVRVADGSAQRSRAKGGYSARRHAIDAYN